MIGIVLALVALAACAAAGAVCLRLLAAAPPEPGERLLSATAAGLGIAGVAGLILAELGALRPLPILAVAAIALAAGGRDVVRMLAAADLRAVRRAWPVVLVCALVLAAELPAVLAPPVGGDQTKYQLAYPRLYAAHGGLVDTPWSFWGHVQFLPNFVFALGYAAGGDVLARLLNGAFGVLATLAFARLVGGRLAAGAGVAGALLFFTLPVTWSLMTRAGSDLALLLYSCLAVDTFLAWRADGRGADLRRTALLAGFAGGSKLMGPLLPALVGLAVVGVVARRLPVRRAVGTAVAFGILVAVAGGPWYVRNLVETGNPVYPFGYAIFGGRDWSAAASDYLGDYYQQYRVTNAARREGAPYVGLDVLRFPWDLTMHPESFESGARQSLDIGPFALAFAPAILLVRRRRREVLATAGFGLAYAGIVAAGAWAHPRYVLPGVVLLLAASVPAAATVVRRRAFLLVIVLTVAGNLALISRLLPPLWPDQVRVALGRLEPAEFLRRHSPRYAFWERANGEIGPSDLVLVLEKIPHPYYIERPFMLGSYLEQDLLDYRTLGTPDALAAAARRLGVTHVAVDVAGLGAGGDPFEASVVRLWRDLLAEECDAPLVREGDYALYALRPELGPTALASAAGDHARSGP